jgi:flagellar hook-associated protein 2
MFTGSSQFSADFQQVVSRAVQIASLPLTQLNNDKTTITNKENAYSSLATKFSAVQTAITNLQSAAQASYAASSSDSTIATVTAGSNATEGSYKIQVTQAGAYSQYLSLNTDSQVTDPTKGNLAAGTSFTLTIDGVDTPITVADGSLSGLAMAINQSGAGAQASIVNLGSPSSPNYVLSVKGTQWKAESIDLKDSTGTSLLGKLSDGQEAQYTVNGLPSTPISTSSPSVIIAPGVTATLQPQAGTTTLSVVRDNSSVANALASFAMAYNNAVNELNQYHGQNAGVLQGDSQINTLAGDLRNLVNFAGGQSINTLGLQFDKNGVLSVDTTKLAGQPGDAINAFLGDGTTSGFLKNANDILNEVNNNLLPSTVQTLTDASTRTGNQITATQDRINQLQDTLNAKMAAADALVASLEQNVSYFQNMFSQMQANAFANK